jgi:HK97 family phage major capsid protein
MNASRQRLAAAQEDARDRSLAKALEEKRAMEPPGMRLDKQPWAHSWSSFLSAIREPRDVQGAQAVITRVMNATGLSEKVGSEGGFLVPWQLSEQVFAYLTEAVIWPRAMKLQMGTWRLALPLLDNPSQADGAQGLGGVVFSTVENNEAIPASNPQFGVTALAAHKLAALISPVPNELVSDAAAAFGDLFGRIIGMGLAWELDELFFNGSGAGEPQGILNAPCAVQVTRTTSDEVLHTDVVAMAKALHPASKKSAVWLASEDVFDFLLSLYETVGTAPSGQQIPPPGSLKYNTQSGQWELLGLPFETTDHQPPIGTPGDLVLADLSLYAIGSREMMTIEQSQLGATFTSDASAYRIRTRVDGRYIPVQPYTLANGKVTSPLVTLQ